MVRSSEQQADLSDVATPTNDANFMCRVQRTVCLQGAACFWSLVHNYVCFEVQASAESGDAAGFQYASPCVQAKEEEARF